MKHYFLKYLNNMRLDVDNDKDEIIIWCIHDRNYKYGSYYKIDKDKNVYFVIEKETEHIEIMLY